MSTDLLFNQLSDALVPARERLSFFVRLRSYSRFAVLGTLALLSVGFIGLVSGLERFPNLVPLLIPAGCALLALSAYWFAGSKLAKQAKLFKAIFVINDPALEEFKPAFEKLRFALENDGTFDTLRAEGLNVAAGWRNEVERVEAQQDFKTWLTAA